MVSCPDASPGNTRKWLDVLKGHYAMLEEKFKLSINEVGFFFHNWMNKLFSEGEKRARTLTEARQVAGSAT